MRVERVVMLIALFGFALFGVGEVSGSGLLSNVGIGIVCISMAPVLLAIIVVACQKRRRNH